jgi:hypothetical protein
LLPGGPGGAAGLRKSKKCPSYAERWSGSSRRPFSTNILRSVIFVFDSNSLWEGRDRVQGGFSGTENPNFEVPNSYLDSTMSKIEVRLCQVRLRFSTLNIDFQTSGVRKSDSPGFFTPDKVITLRPPNIGYIHNVAKITDSPF